MYQASKREDSSSTDLRIGCWQERHQNVMRILNDSRGDDLQGKISKNSRQVRLSKIPDSLASNFSIDLGSSQNLLFTR